MRTLLREIEKCNVCAKHLALGPRPVVTAHIKSKIIVIGQAPGTKVHKTGVPWDDASGKQLRKWMGINDAVFYNPEKVAIVPMGFCYPGKGNSGDLPPRPECAPLWHKKLLTLMPETKLTLLIGQYAQRYYLQNKRLKNLTETVKAHQLFLPDYFVLPHPSPRNRFWLHKNPWFEKEIIPDLQKKIQEILEE